MVHLSQTSERLIRAYGWHSTPWMGWQEWSDHVNISFWLITVVCLLTLPLAFGLMNLLVLPWVASYFWIRLVVLMVQHCTSMVDPQGTVKFIMQVHFPCKSWWTLLTKAGGFKERWDYPERWHVARLVSVIVLQERVYFHLTTEDTTTSNVFNLDISLRMVSFLICSYWVFIVYQIWFLVLRSIFQSEWYHEKLCLKSYMELFILDFVMFWELYAVFLSYKKLLFFWAVMFVW